MKNLKIIIFSLFLLLSFSAHKAEAAVTLQLSALNISGLTSTGTATLPTFSLNINTNDLSDFSSTAVFGINIFNTYNSATQSFSGNAGSGAITVQTGVLQQTKTIAITQPLTNNSIYFARVFYNKGTNLDFVYSNVVSFKFGDSTSVNNNFSPASYITDPLSNGYTPVVLTNNNSGTESGKWWFKQTKDSKAKGPFSNIAECETERAKGNSYSKQCFQFYYPLAPLPGQADKIDTSSSGDSDCPFGNYLNILIKLFIGICAVLAMIKIVLGGMQYMTSELSSGKEDGKNSITSAVFGLILALGAFAILNTINPELLKVCLNNLPKAVVQVDIGGDSNVPFNPIQKTDLQTLGINCSETLAPTLSDQLTQLVTTSNSFLNKTTYSQTKRGTYDASKPTAYLDCSSFVNQVYKCVGKSSPGNWTGTIFNGGEDVTSISGTTINNIQLKTGDLLGWKPGESKKYKGGHVFMYFGNNNIIEAHGPQEIINKSVEIKPLSYYQSEIKHIKRLQ